MDKYEEALQKAKRLYDGLDGYSSNRKVLEEIFPELRESDDERIKKELLEVIRHCYEDGGYALCTDDYKKYSTYLEKQKDNKFAPRVLPCSAAWFEDGEEKQKEHQNKSDAQEKALGRDLTFPHDKDKNLDEIAQDYVDGVREYNPEPTWDLMQTAVCYGYHYCEQKEQKPRENHTLEFEKAKAKYEGIVEGKQIVLDNPEDYGLCKPAEWSEEDSEMICEIIDHCITIPYIGGTLHLSEERKKELKTFIKSLRPSWKPGEEQMSMLLAVINDPNNAGSESCHLALISIYEHLKKLM